MPSNLISFRSFVFILFIPLISIFLGNLFRDKEMSNDSDRQVLPTNVKPYHYDLSLTPNLEAFTFEGNVKINLNVKEDTNVIALNVHDITLNYAKLYSSALKTESSQTATDIAYDNKAYTATLQFPQSVSANSDVILEIGFTGVLNDQMAGFYRSSFQDAEGNTKHLATTQFEPTYARRAFPCWDEPALKATFDVTLVVPAELVALSNMNIISEKPAKDSGKEISSVGEWKEVKYARTPVMSTYLLAFVVGPFEYIEAYTTGEHNGSPVQVRVYTLPGVLEQGRHALGVCTQALEYFAEVFGIPYPLPKMDLVAIPDFEAGAMENWGLVTYRTIALLFDEKSSSIAFKKQVAYTVCHELAHQWFGNLVTMEWWDHLWLNEGFATWVGWLAVDNLYPDWEVWTSFVNSDMPHALTLDALRSSHPIEVSVRDPSEIHQIFDAISYYKGASVIRMLSSWLGVDVFLAGVRRYLHRHKFGNASTGDLWRALGEEAGVDVGGFMQLWTKQIGYPVLNLQTTDSGEIHITQSRYLSTGDLKSEEDSTNWWVPLSVLTPTTSANDEALTLTDKSQTFKLRADSLFKLNAGQTGVYRVNYPVDILLRLGEEAKKGKQGLLKNTSDRVGLVADAGSLSVSGEQKTSAFLELVRNFEDEDEYFVWSQISTHLSNIISAFYEQPPHVIAALAALQRHLFSRLAHKLGWDFPTGEDYLTTMLRIVVIASAARGGDPSTIREAQDRFWRFVRDGDQTAVHPNLRAAVYETALRQAKDETEETAVWEAIFKVYKDTSLPTDQNLIALNRLGDAKSPTLARKLLELSLDTEHIRGQDVIYIWRSVGTNIHTRDIAWDFFATNFSTLHERFATSMNLFGNIVKSAIENFSDQARIDQVEAFFEDKDTREYERPVRQAIETSRVNAKWVARDKADVEAWAEKINALGW